MDDRSGATELGTRDDERAADSGAGQAPDADAAERAAPAEASDATPERDSKTPAAASGWGLVGEDFADAERPRAPGGRPGPRKVRRFRNVPLVRFLAYYVVLVAAVIGLMELFPPVREAFLAPIQPQALQEAQVLTGSRQSVQPAIYTGELDRLRLTSLVILGALALVLPVAWTYMHTRRLRYDPSLIQTMLLLPMVVAGVVLVVKNSLALAFSLAGIVAAVRFRNTLKDPKDAAYVFLILGIGLAAGVQAMDVALVMSLAFNLVMLIIWKYDLGDIYSGGYDEPLAVGDRSVLWGKSARGRRRIRKELADAASGMSTDGVLLAHAPDADGARKGIEISLSRLAKEYRVLPPSGRRSGFWTFAVLIRFKGKYDPLELLGEIEERWFSEIAAAEYIPFQTGKDE